MQAFTDLTQVHNLHINKEDGYSLPFYATVETPGQGNVVNIINTSRIEFLLFASI